MTQQLAYSLLVPPAPWKLSGSALFIAGWLSPRALADIRREYGAQPALQNFVVVFIASYSHSPIGPYQEYFIGSGPKWRILPTLKIYNSFVSTELAHTAGRLLWGAPHLSSEVAVAQSGNVIEASLQNEQEIFTVKGRALGKIPPIAMPGLPVYTERGPRRQLFFVSAAAGSIRRVRLQAEECQTENSLFMRLLLRAPHIALYSGNMRMKISQSFDIL